MGLLSGDASKLTKQFASDIGMSKRDAKAYFNALAETSALTTGDVIAIGARVARDLPSAELPAALDAFERDFQNGSMKTVTGHPMNRLADWGSAQAMYVQIAYHKFPAAKPHVHAMQCETYEQKAVELASATDLPDDVIDRDLATIADFIDGHDGDSSRVRALIAERTSDT